MTSPGSLSTQLENAIAGGNLATVRLIARELQATTGRRMALSSAITTLLLIRTRRLELYPRAVAALLARMLEEISTLTLSDADALLDALRFIEQGHLAAADRELRNVLAAHGQERLAEGLRSPPRGSPRAW